MIIFDGAKSEVERDRAKKIAKALSVERAKSQFLQEVNNNRLWGKNVS